MTLQKRDSIADIFPGVDLGRAPLPLPPIFSGIAHKYNIQKQAI